ncbi:MAG: BPTD_3080 family restriction endonuclease [Phycisphaerales bacterium JB060]
MEAPPPRVVIEHPIINSPFEVPQRHYQFGDHGITNKILHGRRDSSYFTPIARARSRDADQMTLDNWTGDRIEPNVRVNSIRKAVEQWRNGRYTADTTRTTARLLEHWRSPERARRLFFCQIEALETIVFITEVARKSGHQWIENDLHGAAAEANPGLLRMAMKMATGSGKTAVMAMLIAWHTLNKAANPQDARFTDSFLVVAPGITIRDRLRVLLPSDNANYYKHLDLVPADLRDEMHRARIVITNFHSFQRREKVKASRLTKILASGGDPDSVAFKETPGEMVRRVCRELGTSKQIVVLNDEAHHCYRRRVDEAEEAKKAKMTREERAEAEANNKAAHQWLGGIDAVRQKLGVKAVYDLSATPFFLQGSGYSEGTLFPWVVSDFSLVDAIESGIVKVPRVPVADDSMEASGPTYRELWPKLREDPRMKKRPRAEGGEEPKLPVALEGALESLYANYKQRYERWEASQGEKNAIPVPPVFIVVCNNTTVSKMVYDWVAGYEKAIGKDKDGNVQTAVASGRLDLFNNVERGPDGVNRFADRPNTILVDSQELEAGEAMSSDFKKIAAREIDDFKHEYAQQYPGSDPTKITDEDLLREVLNTVGKPGRLGEHVRCVVSVSMLTEGWDANSVTHILGVRAFGTQLLCEQVVGRGLRRMSYATQPHEIEVGGERITIEAFPVEYAEVYGVPFSFIPANGAVSDPKPGPHPTRVRAMEDRIDLELTFPRIEGYRYELPDAPLRASFDDSSKLALSSQDVPTNVEMAPIVGERDFHTLDELRAKRMGEITFLLARRVLEDYVGHHGGDQQPWRFPEVLGICKRWVAECLTCKDGAFPQMLRFTDSQHKAADKIYKAIVSSDGTHEREKRLVALPARSGEEVGSTRYVDFDTTRPTWETDEAKSHISHVVCDTDSWEQKAAQALEGMDEVLAYAKNQGLGFTIPYSLNGESKRYTPDFIVKLDDGHGKDDPLMLVLEVSGQKDGAIGAAKAAKTETARTLWVPAVNNAGRWGRWAFVEVSDPWDLQNTVRAVLSSDEKTPC